MLQLKIKFFKISTINLLTNKDKLFQIGICRVRLSLRPLMAPLLLSRLLSNPQLRQTN